VRNEENTKIALVGHTWIMLDLPNQRIEPLHPIDPPYHLSGVQSVYNSPENLLRNHVNGIREMFLPQIPSNRTASQSFQPEPEYGTESSIG
jgi:hypothetical protein